MAANSRGIRFGYLQGAFGGLGHLYSPGGGATAKAFEFVPYALDNGRFPAWSRGAEWSASDYRNLLGWASRQHPKPMWALVPDVVADPVSTLDEWARWSDEVGSFGWPLAFAVQDGHLASDVPAGAEVVFVGGTTPWKWASLPMWTASFPRVHVDRVNWPARLWRCLELGVESVDGTGWFRHDRLAGLTEFLKYQNLPQSEQSSIWPAERGAVTAGGVV